MNDMKSEDNLVLVDISGIHDELSKERIILALNSKIKYGDVTIKKKRGKIYHVDVHYSLQWNIDDKKEQRK